jgi:hypothetical protein
LFLISCNLREGSKNTGSIAAEQVSMDSEKIAHLKIASAEDYNQALDMLEKKDLKSIDIAIRLFQHAKTDSLSRDSMMVGFNDFLSSVASSYLENNDSLQGRKGIDISDEATRKIKERLAGYGMNLSTSEGEFYLEPDNDYLIQHFGEKISPAYLEFLTISSTEQKQKFADDGTILIPADSIGKRIVTWENFWKNIPILYQSVKSRIFMLNIWRLIFPGRIIQRYSTLPPINLKTICGNPLKPISHRTPVKRVRRLSKGISIF